MFSGQSNASDILKLAQLLGQRDIVSYIEDKVEDILSFHDTDYRESFERIRDLLGRGILSGYTIYFVNDNGKKDYIIRIYDKDGELAGYIDCIDKDFNFDRMKGRELSKVAYHPPDPKGKLSRTNKKDFWERYTGLDTDPDPKLPVNPTEWKNGGGKIVGHKDYTSKAPYNKGKNRAQSLSDHQELDDFILGIRDKRIYFP